MVKVILRTNYTCDEHDDLILLINEENKQDAVANINNFIEELREDTNSAFTTDDVLERISEYYDEEMLNKLYHIINSAEIVDNED